VPTQAAFTADIITLASQYGRSGYRRITALLHGKGWLVNVKRVDRIWRQPSAVGWRMPPGSADSIPFGMRIIRLLADDGHTTSWETALIVRRKRMIGRKAPEPESRGGKDEGSAC
jgi:hypothetical protein